MIVCYGPNTNVPVIVVPTPKLLMVQGGKQKKRASKRPKEAFNPTVRGSQG